MPKHPNTRRSLGLGLIAGLVAALVFQGAGSDAATPARTEPVLPRFDGPMLDGTRGGSDVLKKRRGLLYVFASSDEDAEAVATMLERLLPAARAANVAVLGVARDRDPARARLFAKAHGFDFPVVHDVDLSISPRLPVNPGASALLVVDSESYLLGGVAGLEGDDPRIAEFYEDQIRQMLYLERDVAVVPELGVLPEAPPFEVRRLDGETLSLASLEGKVVVLMFFLPTCPHCHEMLKFFDGLAGRLAHPDLEIVAVSVSPQKYVIEDMARDLGTKLAMYTDPTGAAQRDYAHRHSVPDMLVIDREGRVIGRHSGSDGRLQALLTMEIRAALGVENPILLSRSGYSGDETCRVCHASQHETWSLTSHAYAFETLAQHGEERNPECLPCHTVGWNEKGGYDPATRPHYLEGVQCENCHGRGGPHQSPGFTQSGYPKTCEGCHTPEHSLRFVFEERLPLVSHSANLQFASLSVEERKALLARRDVRDRTLFDKGEFVGSAACQSCHAREHEIWSTSGHAHALETLRKKGQHGDADCQECHTTGFGETGGWPDGGADLANVGCESCHGPGGAHVKDDAAKRGTILALTDKCDSCVILQICGSCHDEANDPGFEFELNAKIDRIRHGFREKTADGKAAAR